MRSRGLGHKKKWVAAKKLGPCYCCSGKGLLGDLDAWRRECGIDCYKDLHHRLLHVVPGSMEGKAATSVTEEKQFKSSTYETLQEHAQGSIALRTVPVILKHGDRRLQVNRFLDEGSGTVVRRMLMRMW